jgi:hypothetical protein
MKYRFSIQKIENEGEPAQPFEFAACHEWESYMISYCNETKNSWQN